MIGASEYAPVSSPGSTSTASGARGGAPPPRGAASLAASWHAVNDAVLAAGRELLIEVPHRFESVEVIGVMSTAGASPARVLTTSRWSST